MLNRLSGKNPASNSMTCRQRIRSAAGTIAFLLACVAYQTAFAVEAKRVLLIYNSVGYSELVATNIRAELQQRSPEFLDVYLTPFAAARAVDENVTTRYADYLDALFHGQSLDLAVAIGSPAMNFFRQYGRQFFPSTPMLAIVEESRAPSDLGKNETIVTTSVDLVGSIETIMRILPETANVSVVIGNSPLEQYWLARSRAAFQPFEPRLSFRFLNDLSFEDILKHAATLPPRSAILFNNLLSDARGTGYPDHEVVSKLHAVAKAPIFTFDDTDFGEGIVGGPAPSTRDLSREYASVALRILGGEALGGLKIAGMAAGPPKFDWREMQRWGIGESRLPPGSTIYFRDPTAWDRYKPQILAVGVAILLQAAFIIWLLHERRYRRRAEAIARDTMSELTHVNRFAAAGELSASIAHEINQPITGIVARAGAARRWLTREKPEIDKAQAALDQIERAGLHASEIIQNIRTVFKRDTHDKVPVDLNRTILAVVALGRHEIQKYQIELRTELDERLPSVTANEVQLQQVILNLLTNAIEAMHFAQPRMLRIRSRLSKPDMVHVSIEDTGIGIDPSECGRIFKPLFTTKATGMGMGLSICRSIIESHGGRIWVSQGVDRGSVFQFELPANLDNQHGDPRLPP
jgi:signal transduction histidine kinase